MSRRRCKRGFTITELLAVVAVLFVLIGVAIPAMQGVRSAAHRTSCLNNMRALQQASMSYTTDHRGWLVPADLPHGGSGDPRNSWVSILPMNYIDGTANLRSPRDASRYWSKKDGGGWDGLPLDEALQWLDENPEDDLANDDISRWSSYGINNLVAAGIAPSAGGVERLSRVKNPAATVQFLMMTEGREEEGADPDYARSDHPHVENWSFTGAPPGSAPVMAAQHVQLHAWGGQPAAGDGRANYGFLDGSVGTHEFGTLYFGPAQNRFHPEHAATFVAGGPMNHAP